MNRDKIIAMLYSIFSGIICHEKIYDEINEIIERSGYEARFFKVLSRMVIFLKAHLENAHLHHNQLESLQQSDLYSMHIEGANFNIRILYSFTSARVPVLLLAFFERAGKNATDYTPYIEPAEKRLEEVLSIYEQGKTS